MIIFLYGNDSFRSTKKLQEIQDKFIKDVDPSRLNLTVVDGASVSLDELNQHLSATPFLAKKRMVVVKNLISGTKKKELQEAAADLFETKGLAKDDSVLAVFWESVHPQGEKKTVSPLMKLLSAQKFAQEFKPLSDAEMKRWVETEASKLGVSIEPTSLHLLVTSIGPDLWRMSNELTKLAHFVNGGTITQALVADQVRSVFEESIFDLIDAIGTKQRPRALQLLAGHLASGEHELGLIAMLQKHFRNLLLIKELQEKQPGIPKDSIATQLAIHPFVAQKAMAQTRAYTLEQLRRIYDRLVHMDFEIKRGADGELLLDILIAQL